MPERDGGAAVSTLDVVTLGEAMQLLVAEPGIALRRATTFRSSIAGAETNVAIGLARLGHRSCWLGRVGADHPGSAVLSMLRAEGVDVSRVEVDPTSYTGLLMRDSHPDRDVEVQYFRTGSAATRLSEDYVRDVFARHTDLSDARLVHVSGITPMLSPTARAATNTLFDLAKEHGALVSLDPNVRRKLGNSDQWRAVLEPFVGRADFVFTGEDELELVTGATCNRAVEGLISGGAHTVLVKNGDKSCTVTTDAGQWHQPSLVTTVVDPVGAGDAVVSGYLSAWLRGETPERALFSGVLSAALVVGAVTDTEGLPGHDELNRARVRATGAVAEVRR